MDKDGITFADSGFGTPIDDNYVMFSTNALSTAVLTVAPWAFAGTGVNNGVVGQTFLYNNGENCISCSSPFLAVDNVSDGLLATSWTVSPVPVPAAAWLFGSALLGLGVIKRKKA
jgi:hypothetical protein